MHASRPEEDVCWMIQLGSVAVAADQIAMKQVVAVAFQTGQSAIPKRAHSASP